MSLRETTRTLELRFYENETPEAYEPYKAICTIVRLDERIAMMVGLKGELSKTDLKELIRKLRSLSYEELVCQRQPGRRIPLAREILEPDTLQGWWRIDLIAVESMIKPTQPPG